MRTALHAQRPLLRTKKYLRNVGNEDKRPRGLIGLMYFEPLPEWWWVSCKRAFLGLPARTHAISEAAVVKSKEKNNLWTSPVPQVLKVGLWRTMALPHYMKMVESSTGNVVISAASCSTDSTFVPELELYRRLIRIEDIQPSTKWTDFSSH